MLKSLKRSFRLLTWVPNPEERGRAFYSGLYDAYVDAERQRDVLLNRIAQGVTAVALTVAAVMVLSW